MAEEQGLVASYITSTLAADSGAGSLGVLSTGITSRIYEGLGDQSETTYPIISFNMQDCLGPLVAVGRKRVWVRFLYQVKVVGKDHAKSELSPIMSRIDTLLDKYGSGAPIAVTGGEINASTFRKSNPIPPLEVKGIVYQQVSHLYEITARAT